MHQPAHPSPHPHRLPPQCRPVPTWRGKPGEHSHDTWVCSHDTWVCSHDTWVCSHDTRVCSHDTWVCSHDTWVCSHDTWVCSPPVQQPLETTQSKIHQAATPMTAAQDHTETARNALRHHITELFTSTRHIGDRGKSTLRLRARTRALH